jgi:hypothetical protein
LNNLRAFTARNLPTYEMVAPWSALASETLRELDLSNSKDLGSAFSPGTRIVLPALEALNIAWTGSGPRGQAATDQLVAAFAAGCPALLRLLLHSSFVSCASLDALAAGCRRLEVLRLGGLRGFAHDDDFGDGLALDFPELRVLVCPAVFGRGVPVERICCPRLRTAMLSRLLVRRAQVRREAWPGGDGDGVGSVGTIREEKRVFEAGVGRKAGGEAGDANKRARGPLRRADTDRTLQVEELVQACPLLEHLDCCCAGLHPARSPALFAATPRLRAVRCGGMDAAPCVRWRAGDGCGGSVVQAGGWSAAMLQATEAGVSWPEAVRRDLEAAYVGGGPPLARKLCDCNVESCSVDNYDQAMVA